jgi:hypothetical protein
VSVCIRVLCAITAAPDSRKHLIELVKRGGEVNPQTLRDLVHRAFMLAFAWHEQALAAVGGLKRPNAAYRARIFDKAGVRDPAVYKFELGRV